MTRPMTIWHHTPSLEQINRSNDNTAVSQLGIEFTEVGDDSLTARMPVDARTKTAGWLVARWCDDASRRNARQLRGVADDWSQSHRGGGD